MPKTLAPLPLNKARFAPVSSSFFYAPISGSISKITRFKIVFQFRLP
jgi:hypothetical protein